MESDEVQQSFTYSVANFGISVYIEMLSTSSHIKLVRKKCVKLESGSLMFDNAHAKVKKVERPSIWIRGRL